MEWSCFTIGYSSVHIHCIFKLAVGYVIFKAKWGEIAVYFVRMLQEMCHSDAFGWTCMYTCIRWLFNLTV